MVQYLHFRILEFPLMGQGSLKPTVGIFGYQNNRHLLHIPKHQKWVSNLRISALHHHHHHHHLQHDNIHNKEQ